MSAASKEYKEFFAEVWFNKLQEDERFKTLLALLPSGAQDQFIASFCQHFLSETPVSLPLARSESLVDLALCESNQIPVLKAQSF